MARHNREAEVTDQCGNRYVVSYQPDWLARIKVTRRLPSGRQSTKVLFRNPNPKPTEAPGLIVRTAIVGASQGLAVEATLKGDAARLRSVDLDWQGEGSADPRMDRVSFQLIPFRESRR